jgi:hypothetical protein
MYFDNLIENIKKNNNNLNLLKYIINPFSTYLLCNHYLGNEITNINLFYLPNVNYLLINNNYNIIKDYD